MQASAPAILAVQDLDRGLYYNFMVYDLALFDVGNRSEQIGGIMKELMPPLGF